MKIIEGYDVSKSYGHKKVLDGLSFSIEENTITGLIGKNGAGKTTLLKTIAGFIKQTSGSYMFFLKNHLTV